ncbi:MAG: hypothetical protein IIZ17_01070 [Eubacteriaceae bacterium]|nr:hypothetical protein [Eubacteriaceae bacterium]MBR2781122.1 hypothetical protein [Eubacteriaceae bacterium]
MKKTGDVVKLGVAAGAAVAATKVAQKYNEIKEQTGGDVNGDGVVDIKDTIEGIKVAAKEVYDQAVTGVEAVKAKVQDPNFINEAKDAVMKKAGEVVEDVKDVANDITENADEYMDNIKANASDLIDDAKEKAGDFIEGAKDAADDLLGSIKQ